VILNKKKHGIYAHKNDKKDDLIRIREEKNTVSAGFEPMIS